MPVCRDEGWVENGDAAATDRQWRLLYIKWQRSKDVATVAVAVASVRPDVSDSKLSPLRPPLLLVGEVNLDQKERANLRCIR